MPLFPVKTMAPAALWSSAPQSHRQSGPGNRGASAESGEEKRRELVEKHELKRAYSLEYNRIFCGIKCGI